MKYNFPLVVTVGLISSIAQSALAADYPANNCEIFIDKAVNEQFRDQYSWFNKATLFVKVLPGRLDAPVKKVAFYHQNGGYLTEAQSFVRSSDYFVITFNTSGGYYNGSGSERFEGALFVETTRGTRYWANSAYGNFVIDDRLADGISYKHYPGSSHVSQMRAIPVGSVPKTADLNGGAEKYLNPNTCR